MEAFPSDMTHRKQALLAPMPATCVQLHAMLPTIAYRSVTRIVKTLHQSGEVHISGWRRNPGGGPSIPVYSAGERADKECTLRYMTGAEWSKKTRERAKKTGQHEINAAKKRQNRKLKRLIATKQTAQWFAALPGAMG